MKRLLSGLCLFLASLTAPLVAQNSNIRLGDLAAYEIGDLPDDATVQEFSALLGQDKVKEALTLAELAAGKKQAVGYFLVAWAAETGKGGEPDLAKAEKNYREAIKLDSVAAKTNLAALLLRQNPTNEEAGKLLSEATEKDPKIAGFFLGIACLSGATGTPDFQSAAQWWNKSAQAGYAKSFRHLGYLYQGMFGFPAQSDLKKSADAFEKGAKADDAESAIRLGILILQGGEKIGRKAAEATAWFEKASATNNPAALFLLGQVREQGVEGSEADPKQARELYEKAAKQDHAPSILKLGYMMERGLGGEAKIDEAIKLYRKAAELGEAGAYFNLGILTQKGEGLEKNEEEAFRLFLQAGQRGFAPAATVLGTAYRAGTGTNPDMIAAAAWFSRAAEAGESNAMVSLAEMMLSNQGIPQNAELLGKLTQTAFNAGNPRAGLLLGRMAERGIGLPQNPAQALAFFQWAAKLGLEDAKTAAAELEKNLTKEQIKAAADMLKEFEKPNKDAAKAEAAPDKDKK